MKGGASEALGAALLSAAPLLSAFARVIAPRQRMKVSDWADAHRMLSAKGSALAGPWRTSTNEPLREPMDCCSNHSGVREVVLMFPIQFGKTEVQCNVLGYHMGHTGGPIMVCLPSEVSMNKWINQKLNPLLEQTPAVAQVLLSVKSRDAANTRTFKDFLGGQLYLEHAGSPSRLKSTSVKVLLVDELDEFAANLTGGDDPVDMLDGRTSAFPATSLRVYISTPQIKGRSRIEEKFLMGDQRRWHVPCPHCGHMQPLEWSGLQWTADAASAWYVCQDCGAHIDEREKPAMLRAGRWVAANPTPRAGIRSYTINALYYPLGLGPRWAELARMWLDAQGDPARLKTFINDRLAESWEDASTRGVRQSLLAERVENWPLRTAPQEVLFVTAGIDTQDDRLEVQLIGWGQGLRFWVLDYHTIDGDPAQAGTFDSLSAYLNAPLSRADGVVLHIDAAAIDLGGHRSEEVKHWARTALVRRPMAVQGAVQANAPVLGRPRLIDISRAARTDRRGVRAWYVGTVAAKHWLFARLSLDADIEDARQRWAHFSHELPPSYFAGLTSESFNPTRGRYEKRRGARNEPLDTWVYAFAAAHHPELRLHRMSAAQWAQRRALLASRAACTNPSAPSAPSTGIPSAPDSAQTPDMSKGSFGLGWAAAPQPTPPGSAAAPVHSFLFDPERF